ncbi:MAG: hypothetical protein H6819_00395 [Phycisphaerales bacterium]|nr:hypothetical protein [Phycisphaerales bacterium]MCB9857332.1 hypothetical protein [Phycisphaerales bacterium]MCB9862954.1 hypothetical protein [Phycisphaerales bacterium]
MAAIMEPVPPDIEEPRADALESPTATAAPEDAIPLESMTWPELKRVARDYDLKLNVKKSVLIRQIREARVAAVQVQAHRETFHGRIEAILDEARRRVGQARESLVDWWKADETDRGGPQATDSNDDRSARLLKVAIWGGGLLAGGVFAVIYALM